ncbi:nudix hydrolase 2-like isoform X1 [Cryptomeria japonica]|uniref:nudix hydrolase 2-like isoform X1 n=1 Tax=Cryptomeria japonica TaxID=3369 RepID=UPI0027DAAF27|nr:nudix hydrolase 2-like isoform X1 [Cryptomeria japonica]
MAIPTNDVSSTSNDVINSVETILNESSVHERCEVLKVQEDRYDGVIVDLNNMQNDATRFATSLKASLSLWARQSSAVQGKRAVWIKVPKEQATLVPVAIEAGFWYHHAEPSYVMVVYWIPQIPCTIPDNASHQVGIAAFVFNDKGEVLVVQEKCGPYKDSGLWKMPTGRINQGEGIKEGAIREVHEETGIETEFVQVVGFRDGHNALFGKSDMLFVCILKSVSCNIAIQETEISVAKWMAVEEFAAQPKNQQSKLLKDMIGACVARMDRRCEGFSAVEMPANLRKPSAFYCGAVHSV